jgi:hypothetical protein
MSMISFDFDINREHESILSHIFSLLSVTVNHVCVSSRDRDAMEISDDCYAELKLHTEEHFLKYDDNRGEYVDDPEIERTFDIRGA